MHRILLFCCIFFSLIIPVYPAPSYGTKMPRKGELFGGLQTHAILKRYLESQWGKVRSLQNFFLLSWGAFDWLSVDLKGGVGYIKQHPSAGGDEVDYPSFFAGGYGFRVKLYEKNSTKVTFGFQHISVHPKKIRLGDVKNKAVLDDWQISMLISHSFFKSTPYLGAKWSRVDYIHWQDEDRKRRMSDLTKSAGLILGFDFPLDEKIWLNAEGQFFDSEALALSINFKF